MKVVISPHISRASDVYCSPGVAVDAPCATAQTEHRLMLNMSSGWRADGGKNIREKKKGKWCLPSQHERLSGVD